MYFFYIICTFVGYNENNENTGRFIMFSMITNIYNQKTKDPTLMEFSQPQGNWKSFFFDN